MRIFLAACCLFLATLALQAQTETTNVSDDYRTGSFVETRSVMTRDRPTFHEVKTFAAKRLIGRWGVYAYGETSDFDSRSGGGVTYQPTSWLRVGVGGGFDESAKPIRGSVLVQVVRGKFDSTTLVDFGASRTRITHATNYRLDEVTRVGVVNEPSFGLGPRIEVKPGRRVAAWAGVFRNSQSKRMSFGCGLRAYF